MSNTSDTTTNLLQKLQNGEITLEACQQQLKSKQTSEKTVTYKCSPKGCISFYGLRRMPISLYKEELIKILGTIMDCEGEMPYDKAFKDFLNTAPLK